MNINYGARRKTVIIVLFYTYKVHVLSKNSMVSYIFKQCYFFSSNIVALLIAFAVSWIRSFSRIIKYHTAINADDKTIQHMKFISRSSFRAIILLHVIHIILERAELRKFPDRDDSYRTVKNSINTGDLRYILTTACKSINGTIFRNCQKAWNQNFYSTHDALAQYSNYINHFRNFTSIYCNHMYLESYLFHILCFTTNLKL